MYIQGQAAHMAIHLVLDESFTEAGLKALIDGAEASNTSMCKAIAQNDQIRDMAKLRLLSLELAEAERE
ncbi:hypothetical protein [Paraburkholderia graminis]|uniref:hypothetical protein n=1 Tax=Paraburkholderia graminis TaxID=60548 RepID=UPI0038BACEEF